MKLTRAAVLVCVVLTSFAEGRPHTGPTISVQGVAHLKEFLTIRVEGGKKAVTICERLLIAVKSDAGIEDAPRAFDVEYLDKGKWLLDTSGIPDVKPMYNLVHLSPGSAKNYRLRIFEPGVYRFRLQYAIGDDFSCPLAGGASKAIFSGPIRVE